MLLLGNRLAARGVECEYWFCRTSNRWPQFEATGRATLAPLSQLAKRLERGDFDVVHLTASDELAPLVAHMARHARVVVTSRGALAEGWSSENCFAYTAISEGMAEVNQPYTNLKVEVVRNAIEAERFAPPENLEAGAAPIVAFVGRTTAAEKDFPRFTRIARELVAEGARVWIADPRAGSWKDFAGADVATIPVERWGAVPNTEIPEFYRAIAASNGVLVITSTTEGFGLVAPEAAACGVRVAAPNIMGLREAIIDGSTGRLFPRDASDTEVAGMIKSWLSESHDMAQCSLAARSTFSPDVLADTYMSIYGRKDQLTVSQVPDAKPYDEQPLLLAHLERQRTWRAGAARQAARDLASQGYGDYALRALAQSFRASPKSFANAGNIRHVSGTVRQLIGRSFLRRLSTRMRSR